MEMILGVIEDALDQYDNGSPDEKEDATQELKRNMDQFKSNLQPLVDGGNADAKSILDRLNGLSL
jgi:hypothetical protein